MARPRVHNQTQLPVDHVQYTATASDRTHEVLQGRGNLLEKGRTYMTGFIHWLEVDANVLAVLVTVGVAVLLICCMECSDCSKREKDDLFDRHEV